MRRGWWLCLLAAGAFGAAATVPQLWVQFALPGDTALRKAGAVVIDSPLTFTADAAGKMHLGIALPLVGVGLDVLVDGKKATTSPSLNLQGGPGLRIVPVVAADNSVTLQFTLDRASGCTADAAGNLTCPAAGVVPPLAPPGQAVIVAAETPVPGTAPGTWTLAHAPLEPGHSFCIVGGAVSQFGPGYTLAGAVITAAWPADAVITCSYSYAP